MLGPIDYVILGFKGNKFDGSIMDELISGTENSIIRIMDLVLVVKHKDGQVTEIEYADLSDDLKASIGDLQVEGDVPLLTNADIEKVSRKLEPDTTAGILVIEHLWARNLKRAIADANGYLIDYGRVQPEKVKAAVKELAHAKV